MENSHPRGTVNAIECISTAWNLFAARPGLYIGISVLLVCFLCFLLVINWFISGPILLGIYYVVLRQIRGEPIDFGMFFKGFEQFLPAMLIGLLMLIPVILHQTFAISMRVARLLAVYYQNELSGGILALTSLLSLFVSLLFLSGIVIVFILFTFSLPLLLEQKLGVVDTIKLSAKAGWENAGSMFLLAVLEGLVLFGGALACCVGVFAALPIVLAANAVAYRQVFPDVNAPSQAPPTPDQYSFQ